MGNFSPSVYWIKWLEAASWQILYSLWLSCLGSIILHRIILRLLMVWLATASIIASLNETNPSRSSAAETDERIFTYSSTVPEETTVAAGAIPPIRHASTQHKRFPKFYKLSSEQLSAAAAAAQRRGGWRFRAQLVLKKPHRSGFLLHSQI